MQIRCVSCRKDIPAEDVNIDNALAKCRACHAVFDFRDQVKTATPATPIKKREPVPMPKNLVVAEGPQTLDIVRKWGRGPGYFFLVFAGFWNATLANVVVFPGAFDWLFMTPFILIGLGTGYAALALLLNRTIIQVEGNELRVSHQPFRWPGAKLIDVTQISQLYCSEYVAYKQNNSPQYRMKVHAMMLDGSRLDLISGIEDADQALYLEQILEKRLGIEDRPVKGEYQGGHLD